MHWDKILLVLLCHFSSLNQKVECVCVPPFQMTNVHSQLSAIQLTVGVVVISRRSLKQGKGHSQYRSLRLLSYIFIPLIFILYFYFQWGEQPEKSLRVSSTQSLSTSSWAQKLVSEISNVVAGTKTPCVRFVN